MIDPVSRPQRQRKLTAKAQKILETETYDSSTDQSGGEGYKLEAHRMRSMTISIGSGSDDEDFVASGTDGDDDDDNDDDNDVVVLISAPSTPKRIVSPQQRAQPSYPANVPSNESTPTRYLQEKNRCTVLAPPESDEEKEGVDLGKSLERRCLLRTPQAKQQVEPRKKTTTVTTPTKRARGRHSSNNSSPSKKVKAESEDIEDVEWNLSGKKGSNKTGTGKGKRIVIWNTGEKMIFAKVFTEASQAVEPSRIRLALEQYWSEEGLPVKTSADINNHVTKWRKHISQAALSLAKE